jgi:hypothetical protein
MGMGKRSFESALARALALGFIGVVIGGVLGLLVGFVIFTNVGGAFVGIASAPMSPANFDRAAEMVFRLGVMGAFGGGFLGVVLSLL